MPANQNPEQIARDAIDAQLQASGRSIQNKDAIGLRVGAGQVVCEYSTDTKTSIDLLWLKDDSHADLDNLPEPTDLAEEIIEIFEAGLASFRAVAAALGN